MDSSGHNDRSICGCMLDQTGTQYRDCPCLLWTHYSGLSGGHDQGVNLTGVMPIAYPGASDPGPSFQDHTPSYPNSYEEGSSSHFHRQRSAYAIPPQVLSCDYTSEVPATVSDNVLYEPGGNQDMGAYPASAPAERLDAQVAVLGSMFFPASHMQPPYVAPPPLKNEVAITSAVPESSILRNAICDTGWNQDMGTYPAHPAQWDPRAAPGPIPSNTGDKQPTSVERSLFEDKATNVAFAVSTPNGPTHNLNTDKYCPICATLLSRLQDRERHILSHLPRWLQCEAPGCSWRGDRWEHLRKHRLKVHPSISQESVTCGSVIYDPWPLVKGITDNTTFENAKTMAISLVEAKAKELKRVALWGDLFGRRRRSRKVYSQSPR